MVMMHLVRAESYLRSTSNNPIKVISVMCFLDAIIATVYFGVRCVQMVVGL